MLLAVYLLKFSFLRSMTDMAWCLEKITLKQGIRQYCAWPLVGVAQQTSFSGVLFLLTSLWSTWYNRSTPSVKLRRGEQVELFPELLDYLAPSTLVVWTYEQKGGYAIFFSDSCNETWTYKIYSATIRVFRNLPTVLIWNHLIHTMIFIPGTPTVDSMIYGPVPSCNVVVIL